MIIAACTVKSGMALPYNCPHRLKYHVDLEEFQLSRSQLHNLSDLKLSAANFTHCTCSVTQNTLHKFICSILAISSHHTYLWRISDLCSVIWDYALHNRTVWSFCYDPQHFKGSLE